MSDNPFDQFDSAPRGVRNNNPLNLTGDKWQGQTGTDGRFAQFDTPEAGRAAADANLVAYHQKHGLDTVQGVVGRWAPPSENDTGAYAKTVAAKLGVDPGARLDMTDPAVRYRLLDAMQEQETGQKATNPFDHFDVATAAPAAKPSPAKPKPPAAPSRLPQRAVAPAPGPTIAQDALSGFVQPWQDLGHTVMEGYRSTKGGHPLDPLFIPKLAGASANLSASLLLPAVRPAVRAFNNGAGAVGLSPHDFTWNPKAPFRELHGEEAQRKTEGDVMTALSAAQPEGARFTTLPKPKAMSLEQLQTAKSAAYKAVESSGVQVTPQGFSDLASTITQQAAADHINPIRHDKAASMISDINDMAAKGYSPSLTELDQLRQVVRRDVANPKVDDGNQHFGNMIIGAIDDFVAGAKGPQVTAPPGADPDGLLKTARDLNTRYRKVEAVTNARESAVQRAGSTASGGNVNNATAQNIRKFTDPTSSKYMRNMTPAERKLAESIVKPGKGQNLLRLLGKLSPSGNGLMAALNLGATMHNPAMGAVGLTGIAAKAAADGATAGKVDQLIKLMSMGGSAARPTPPIPMLTMAGRPALPILSPAGIVGSGVVAAPLTRTRAVATAEKANARPGRGKLPRR